MLKSEIYSDPHDLCGLTSQWSRFVHGQAGSTPFQLPHWLLTWWAHFGSGELRTWVFRNGDGLAGVVPCFLHEWKERRQLTLLGTGVSDYLEPVIVAPDAAEIKQLLSRDLERLNDWNICVWQDLDAPSAVAQIDGGAKLSVAVQPDTACSEIPIEETFEEYWSARPHGLKRNVRRYLTKAQQVDAPQFSVTCHADAEALNSLITLHTERWSRQGQAGMLAANKSAAFLRQVVRHFAAEDLVRFFTMRFQGKIVAVILGFAYRNVLYAYLSGFDPEYAPLGFGRILLFEALRHSFENGYTSWNFLRGTEPYKFEWGAREILKQRVVIQQLG